MTSRSDVMVYRWCTKSLYTYKYTLSIMAGTVLPAISRPIINCLLESDSVADGAIYAHSCSCSLPEEKDN